MKIVGKIPFDDVGIGEVAHSVLETFPVFVHHPQKDIPPFADIVQPPDIFKAIDDAHDVDGTVAAFHVAGAAGIESRSQPDYALETDIDAAFDQLRADQQNRFLFRQQ